MTHVIDNKSDEDVSLPTKLFREPSDIEEDISAFEQKDSPTSDIDGATNRDQPHEIELVAASPKNYGINPVPVTPVAYEPDAERLPKI